MLEANRSINVRWAEWKPGEMKSLRGCYFQEVVFDRIDKFRIRLIFEKDLSNQECINILYNTFPGNLDLIFDCLGKKVESVVAEGSQSKGSYLVKFTDKCWFRI